VGLRSQGGALANLGHSVSDQTVVVIAKLSLLPEFLDLVDQFSVLERSSAEKFRLVMDSLHTHCPLGAGPCVSMPETSLRLHLTPTLKNAPSTRKSVTSDRCVSRFLQRYHVTGLRRSNYQPAHK